MLWAKLLPVKAGALCLSFPRQVYGQLDKISNRGLPAMTSSRKMPAPIGTAGQRSDKALNLRLASLY